MKAIMVMFDSLNRRMLPPYGGDWVHAPNFKRLAEKSVTFENSWVGSMPCMPARRELHTGRYNFLHRGWGPIEPFDDSIPEMLKNAGVHTHLTSDHYHYWEEGGANYHTRYSTWESHRGQEGDHWIADLSDPTIPRQNEYRGNWGRQDWVNRSYMPNQEDLPQARTFESGLEFMERNGSNDNWFLQIETFDPHEPFYAPKKYQDLYDWDFSRTMMDWPDYRRVAEGEEELVTHFRYCQAALTSMCDDYLGQVMDKMDEKNMWEDTMLMVCTDHGFLIGEHDWYAKCVMPFYNEIAHTPFFVWDPRLGIAGERRESIVQTIDWGPTLLDFFGMSATESMSGKSIRGVMENDTPIRQAGLFGVFGGHVNVTDGKYVYMRAPAEKKNEPLFEYTLMPTHMRRTFAPEEFEGVTLAEPFSFTKGCRTMKIKARPHPWNRTAYDSGTLLFDIEQDYQQEHPISSPSVEILMTRHLVREMRAADAPPEQYDRIGMQTPRE